jgi:protein ImuB
VPPLACVSLPELPLQLVVRMHPEWRDLPVAVLSEDRPTGIVLHRNRAAARTGVRRGMRYSAALALTSVLRAAVAGQDELSRGNEEIGRLLQGFSPRVEPCPFADGIFWLDARGLGYLFTSTVAWMEAILRGLDMGAFRARISAGFTRGGTLVSARASRDGAPRIFTSPEEELAFCSDAPLGILPLGPAVRRRLGSLGIRTIQQFLALPAGGVRMRMGQEAARFHELLATPTTLPLQHLQRDEELVVRHRFDREVCTIGELEPPLDEALQAVVDDAARRGVRIRELVLLLSLEDGETREERLRPSEPTAACAILRDLLRLRISSLYQGQEVSRRRGITGFTLAAERSRGRNEQIELIQHTRSRDRAAGERAFALIRAELGNDVVRMARVNPEHPPERQYSWETLGEHLRPPHAISQAATRTLVRRFHESPRSMTPAHRHYRGCGGPYTLSGAWWARPYDREYRFIEAADGTVLWIFRDGGSAQWMVHGELA